MIVPFPPGGLTDVLGRVLAAGMETSLGQSVVVENVGGADGSIGTGRAARAAPDGYTMVLGIWNTTITQILWFGGLAAVPDITRGSYLFFLKPVIAAALALIILAQPISLMQMLAILIICGAVLIELAWPQIFRAWAVRTG